MLSKNSNYTAMSVIPTKRSAEGSRARTLQETPRDASHTLSMTQSIWVNSYIITFICGNSC